MNILFQNIGFKYLILIYALMFNSYIISLSVKDITKLNYLAKNNTKVQSFFSHKHNLENIFCFMVNNEKKKIEIASFCFSSNKIIGALSKASKRNVKVEVILDDHMLKNKLQVLELLSKSGIEYSIYKSKNGCMHHKFAIFYKCLNDKTLVWTGSSNFTYYGLHKNNENIILINDKNAAIAFSEEFKQLAETI